MATPSFFELNQIESFVQKEFKRRSQDIGFNYAKGNSPDYKGPRAAWSRICSNAQPGSLEGFVMYGVNGFDDTYGFQKSMPGTVLGYDVNGKSHTINESTYKHRACPGVTGIDVDLVGGAGKFRKTSIHWVCWSAEQFDYLESYFLIPQMSIIAEWGWNNFDPTSLFNLSQVDGTPTTWKKVKSDGSQEQIKGTPGLRSIFSDEDFIRDKILKSNGNYDFSFGKISDWSYTLREDGGYNVTTVILNTSQMYSAFSTKESVIKQNGQLKKTILEWTDKDLPRLIELVETKQNNIVNSEYGSEDRAFYGKKQDKKSSNFYELAYGNENTFWMTFGLVVDVFNYFYSFKDGKSNIPHFEIVLRDSIICAHANLKSIDADVLLIPNSKAPSGDPGTESTSSPEDSGLAEANQLLKKSKLSTQRVNLVDIICEKRSESKDKISFPDYGQFPKGNAGYLRNLYVNAEVVKKAITSNENIDSAIMEILNAMSKAAGGIWDFDLKSIGPSGQNLSYLTVVDKNYIGTKNIQELQSESTLYKFDLSKSDGIVIHAGFNVKPSSAVVMQTIMQNTPSDNTKITTKEYLKYKHTDRIFGELQQKESIKESESSQESSEAKFSRNESDPKYAIVKIDTNTGKKKIRLCEPNQDVQKAIITDNDTHNNAIHNGIMPNTSLELTIQGISGIKYLDCFSVENGLPKRYRDDVLFQVTGLKHVLTDGSWNTIITAGVRPRADIVATN